MPDEDDDKKPDDATDNATDDAAAAVTDATDAVDATETATETETAAATDDGKSPFDEFGDPTGKKEEAKPALGDTPADAGDALDKRLEAAEDAFYANPMDEEAGKEHRAAVKAVRERDAKRLKAAESQAFQAAESSAYERFEESCGLPAAPPAVRSKLTREVIKARFQKHFDAERKVSGDDNEARGAARANLRHEIRQIIAAAGKVKPGTKPVRTAGGGTLTPPGGVGGRAQKPAAKAEDVFIKGDWSYPSLMP